MAKPQSSYASHAKSPPEEEAAKVGLRYLLDNEPGITRVERGSSFTYRDALGKTVTNERTLERIRAIVIPPSWTDVWISPSASGHLQATGRDARGRKQYRYHAKWSNHRNATKFSRMVDFARVLPTIRVQVEKDLHRRELVREKVLATVISLLERTSLRIGNDEYARSNKSFGLTTLRDRHAELTTTSIRLSFRGKSGKPQQMTLQDRRLARIVKHSQDLPGQRLFAYEGTEGAVHSIGSADVNAYIREIAGADFTAKDFRTWIGTTVAAGHLRHLPRPGSEAEANREILGAIDAVAEQLNNTRTVARKAYIHPAIFEAFRSGKLQKIRLANAPDIAPGGLDQDERIVLKLLSGT